jgi:chromosome segregation ATPase
MSGRVNELENLDPKTQRDKISDFQATLANLVERVGASEVCASHAQAALVDMRNKIDQLANRTQEISDHVKTLEQFASSSQTRLQTHDEQLSEISSALNEISDSQAAQIANQSNFQKSFKAEISDKIDRLQKQLSREISDSLKSLAPSENSGQNRTSKISDQQLLNNMVSAAQKAIASAMGSHAQEKFRVRVLDVWREAASEGGKRRIAVRLLNRCIARVFDRSIFSVWRDKVQIDRLRHQLEITVSSKIPSPDQILGQHPQKLESLNKKVEVLEAALKEQEQVRMEDNAEFRANSGRTMEELRVLSSTVAEISGKTEDKYKPVFDYLTADLKKITAELTDLKKTVDTDYATNKDLQKLMTDVLLLWNSLKQLDATKADRSDFERLAAEWNNKVAEMLRNFDDFSVSLTALQSKQQSAAVLTPAVAAVSSGADPAELQKLQAQLMTIAQYLFDLVGRLAGMRGIDASKLPVFPSPLLPENFVVMPQPHTVSPAAPSGLPPPPAMAASRASLGSGPLMETQNTAELLRYARSLVTAAGGSRSPQNLRRELILPADLRLDGAPVVPRRSMN